ncbi:interleukin-15 receptor subunit alpha isoform X14 [Homo sapiens]|uniref:interleukin-15 receptor subunit alpha isoform X14 n=1 Tax=Homo sapiens TaxID=9606 RepID=UPI001FB0AEC7|nr:interleukin-15 receptor subunit alpha isoform X14 [Homo sapiens]
MRLAGRQVPEQRSPPPPGLGSARPGSPAVSCGAAAMAPRRARGCRTLGLPALLLLLLLRPPATRDARDRLAVLAGRSRISESFNHEVQTHEACVRLRTMENCPQCHHHRTSRQQAGITCPPPMSVEHADIWVKSYSLYSRERYICNSGFKRKAGTSSLTECVLNKATNVAHWTTPSLKCIKPAASSPSSNNTAATTAAIVPGSQLMPSKSPSTGTTEISSHESSHGTPSQTTAKNWELTASASHQPPGVYPQGHSDTTVAISTSTVLLCGLSAVSLLACYLKSRQTPPLASVEMEAMEALPVTWGTSSRDEDLENCSHHL